MDGAQENLMTCRTDFSKTKYVLMRIDQNEIC